MKKTLLFHSLLVGVFVGFVAPPAMAQDSLCSPFKFRLRLDTNLIRLNPREPKCISSNTFKIKINVLDPEAFELSEGQVTVKEKPNPDGYTIEGSNDDASDITMLTATINGESSDGSYVFEVDVAGHGKLDPRVQIIDIDVLRDNRLDLLEEYALEEFGLYLERSSIEFSREE